MNLQEYKSLLAERTTLQRLLASIPIEDVLDRSGLRSRLDILESELRSVTPPNREPARARLTFRGRPVVGQHGIFAEFGAKATSAFADAVAKVAAGLSGQLISNALQNPALLQQLVASGLPQMMEDIASPGTAPIFLVIV